MTAMARARGGGIAGNVLRSAARGAVLIGVAVVLGIVLLQVVDDSGIPSGGRQPPQSNGNTTSTTVSDAGRPSNEVSVYVLNGSGVQGAAVTKSNVLRGLGYAIAGTGNSTLQQGTTLACMEGFSKEADELAVALAVPGARVVDYVGPPPAGTENADCVVILGTA